MKVKIKKEGKVKEFKLIQSWEDVTLERYIKLVHSENESKIEEALKLIDSLTTIPKNLVKQLGVKEVAAILEKLADLQKEDSYLKNIISLNGKEYGFHPNFDELTIGEYADIEVLFKNDIHKHLPELMAILYRPVTDKGENGVYSIAAYDGNTSIRAEEFKQMKASMVQGALLFFWSLGSDLLLILPSFLLELTEKMKKEFLENPSKKSGHGSE
tara:strand:- start:716 stop:1357 length:642 start_codon:yes stop_codon:yes gene_type:complete